MSINLVPGVYPVNNSTIFPQLSSGTERIRHIMITDPTRLPEAVSVVHSYGDLTLVTVTPTALFVAGALLSYRHDELTPVGGAIAGGKVTAGFLALSVAGVYLFTAIISGLTLSTSGSVSLGGGASLELVEGTFGLGASVEPVISIGPSLGRAVLSGFFYPLLFGTAGGAAGAKANAIKLPAKVLEKFG